MDHLHELLKKAGPGLLTAGIVGRDFTELELFAKTIIMHCAELVKDHYKEDRFTIESGKTAILDSFNM
jgi:hypothetical protein